MPDQNTEEKTVDIYVSGLRDMSEDSQNRLAEIIKDIFPDHTLRLGDRPRPRTPLVD